VALLQVIDEAHRDSFLAAVHVEITADLALTECLAGSVFEQADLYHLLIEANEGFCVELHLRLSFPNMPGRRVLRLRCRRLPLSIFPGGTHIVAPACPERHAAHTIPVLHHPGEPADPALFRPHGTYPMRRNRTKPGERTLSGCQGPG